MDTEDTGIKSWPLLDSIQIMRFNLFDFSLFETTFQLNIIHYLNGGYFSDTIDIYRLQNNKDGIKW